MFTASCLHVLGLLQVQIARCSKLVPIELLCPEGVVQGMEPAECFTLPLKERQRGGLSQALWNKLHRHVHKVKNRGRRGIILCFLGALLLLLLLQLGHEPGEETKCVVRSISQPFSVVCPVYMHNQWLFSKGNDSPAFAAYCCSGRLLRGALLLSTFGQACGCSRGFACRVLLAQWLLCKEMNLPASAASFPRARLLWGCFTFFLSTSGNASGWLKVVACRFVLRGKVNYSRLGNMSEAGTNSFFLRAILQRPSSFPDAAPEKTMKMKTLN